MSNQSIEASEPFHLGDIAPDFTGQAHTGEEVTLTALRGNPVVLFFYPKDDTPGCTKEACAFRDLAHEFAAVGAKVLGISRDSLASHGKFATKFELTMPLLSDTDEAICKLYDVLKEKTMYGKTSIGVQRSTFVIDKDGKFAKIYRKVNVDGHVDDVLQVVRSL